MSEDFVTHWRKHLRITILRLLAAAPGYCLNESLLHGHLPRLSFSCTRDQVRTEISWLGQQGLVHVESEGDLLIASLSTAGLDVAEGRGTHPDVQRPSPRRR